jgi:hypothetical protein
MLSCDHQGPNKEHPRDLGSGVPLEDDLRRVSSGTFSPFKIWLIF